MRGQAKPYTATYRGDLADDRDIFKVRKAGTAIRLGNEHTHQTQMPHFPEDLVGEGLCFVPLHYIGLYMADSKIAGCVAHFAGEFIGRKIHLICFCYCFGRPGPWPASFKERGNNRWAIAWSALANNHYK